VAEWTGLVVVTVVVLVLLADGIAATVEWWRWLAGGRRPRHRQSALAGRRQRRW
jgi:hypothetical protein